jgi:hypothetical protein
VKARNHSLRITREARLDLRAWHEFLENFNGRLICLPNDWASSDTLNLYSHASGSAYAAVLGCQWFQGSFPDSWLDVNIAVKELLPIVLSVRIWPSLLENKRILFLTDNEAIVPVINKLTSKNHLLMKLIRQLAILTLSLNISCRAKHIPGKTNVIADLLSRQQVHKAKALAPWLSDSPKEITQEWLPW